MTYIIADPDCQNGVALKKILDGYAALACQGYFTTPGPAEKSIRERPPDLAFIRCGKAAMNAFRLARLLKAQSPGSRLVFVGDDRESAVEAFEYEADGFLLMPLSNNKVERLLRLKSRKEDRS